MKSEPEIRAELDQMKVIAQANIDYPWPLIFAGQVVMLEWVLDLTPEKEIK